MTSLIKKDADVVPPCECPACGNENDRASSYNCNVSPKIGDIAVCFTCGAINRYSKGMALEIVPDAEVATDDFSEACEVQKKVRELRGMPTGHDQRI
jgi:hypothetical protein